MADAKKPEEKKHEHHEHDKKHEHEKKPVDHKKHIVTVFGATGHQGGSLVHALLKEGFQVRGVTRKLDSKESKELKAKGVDMVECDMVKASEDDLKKVMKDSYGVFLMTNFWDPSSMNKEEDLGKKLVDAAHKAGVHHVQWSGLANVEKYSNGKWKVPHFTDKAKVSKYIKKSQKKKDEKKSHRFHSYSLALPAFYYQNFANFGMVKKEGDKATMTLPEFRYLTSFDIHEFGTAAAQYFKNPDKMDGKNIEYWAEHAHPQAYADAITKVTGVKVELKLIPRDVYGKSGHPGAEELAQMCGWFDEYSYYGPKGKPFAAHSAQRQTPGGLTNFENWLRKGGAKEMGF